MGSFTTQFLLFTYFETELFKRYKYYTKLVMKEIADFSPKGTS